MPDQRLLICPYCGETQPESDRCQACAGLFEPLSRQATHNAMGPWFIRDDQRPHQPGCSYETLVKLIQRGRVMRYTIMRGPTTRQFWTIAKRVPGISHYFGACYQCDASVDPDDRACHGCGATFGGFLDRNFLGLPEYRPLPWEGDQSGQRRTEVEPGEPSDWRQQTASTTGGPRGISSFATDEELLGEVPIRPGMTSETSPAVERRKPGSPAEESSAHSAPAATAVESAPAPDEPSSEPNTVSSPLPDPRSGIKPNPDEITHRALQRKLARQQRTIRVLGALAIGLSALAIVLALVWLDSRSAPTMPAEAERDRPEVADVMDGDPLRDQLDPTAPVIGSGEPLDEPPAKAESFSEAYEAAYDEARHLIERAGDADTELAERIGDLEKAVAVLEQIKRDVVESALPEDFADTLREARRMLERLRLREFFP